MQSSDDAVTKDVSAFLVRTRKHTTELTPDMILYGDGLGLDSLEAAELSVVLEDKYGADPFSAGLSPQTVGDVLTFYRDR